MKLIAMMFGLGMAAMGILSLATMGPAPMNYQAASLDEKQVWLDEQADSLRRAARWGLPSGQGPMAPNFYLKDVTADAEDGIVEMNVRVELPYGATYQKAPRDLAHRQICRIYDRTRLGENDIRFVARFEEGKQKVLDRIEVTANRCANYAAEKSAENAKG